MSYYVATINNLSDASTRADYVEAIDADSVIRALEEHEIEFTQDSEIEFTVEESGTVLWHALAQVDREFSEFLSDEYGAGAQTLDDSGAVWTPSYCQSAEAAAAEAMGTLYNSDAISDIIADAFAEHLDTEGELTNDNNGNWYWLAGDLNNSSYDASSAFADHSEDFFRQPVALQVRLLTNEGTEVQDYTVSRAALLELLADVAHINSDEAEDEETRFDNDADNAFIVYTTDEDFVSAVAA